jgi:hypothetical protein
MVETPVPPTRRVKYHEVHQQIQTGDLFLFRGNYESSKIFERLTHAFYSHATIVAWWHERLMILQAEGPGIQAIPLSVAVSQYPGRADWYRLRRDTIPDVDAKVKAVMAEAKADLGLPFGVLDLFKGLLHWGRNVTLTEPVWPRAMFCSEYVERCFRTGGMSLTGKTDIISFPKDVAVSPLIEYMATIEHDPAHTDARSVDDVPEGAI